MSEANQNDTSFDNESTDVDCSSIRDAMKQSIADLETSAMDEVNSPSYVGRSIEGSHPASQQNNLPDPLAIAEDSSEGSNDAANSKMNWQKVAHKLREYNRKLLKKVFRLEQELAEIDNKFNKYVEKSRNSDLLLAHQAEEIKLYQEKLTSMTQQLTGSQQQVNSQELLIEQISQQQEQTQKQTAQLERECTLLQEKYNDRAYELAAKESENQELQSKLDEQEKVNTQIEAQLKRERATRKEKAISRHQNYSHNRFIQPWSNSIPEPKIPLPKAKSQDREKKKAQSGEVTKTAAEIATWSATKLVNKKNTQATKAESAKAKSSSSKKPQSLAAVDLPTFPRPH